MQLPTLNCFPKIHQETFAISQKIVPFQISGSNRPFVVASASISLDEKNVRTLNCLLVYVESVEKADPDAAAAKNGDKSTLANVVEWISLVESPEPSFKLDRVRRYLFFGALVKHTLISF